MTVRIPTYVPIFVDEQNWLNRSIPDWKLAWDTVVSINGCVQRETTTYYIEVPNEAAATLYRLRFR